MAEHKDSAAKKTVDAAATVGTAVGLGADLASRNHALVEQLQPFRDHVEKLLHSANEVSVFMTSHFPKEMAQINQSGELTGMIAVGVLISLGATWFDKLRVKDQNSFKELLTSTFEVMRTPFLVALPYLLATFPVALDQLSKGSPEGTMRFSLTAVSALIGVMELGHAWHTLTHLGWTQLPQQELTAPVTALGYGRPPAKVEPAPAPQAQTEAPAPQPEAPTPPPIKRRGRSLWDPPKPQVVQVGANGQAYVVDEGLEQALGKAMDTLGSGD